VKTPSNTPSAEPINDPGAFDSEGIIELTEVVEEPDSCPDIPITVDSPEERYGELKKEISKIGGEIQECKNVEGHTLAKVDISNERYVITCALAGIEANHSIASIREGVHLVLKGQETGFHILGGEWMNHIEPFVVDIAYSTIENPDQFFGLNANLERHHSKKGKQPIKPHKERGLNIKIATS